MNYEFDLEAWLLRCPLREKYGHYSGCPITGPNDLCNNEWLRRELEGEYDWGPPVPVDVFVMSKGEPENRAATKIGGLPYRSRNLPWPLARSGSPLELIAQFNFTNSADIVGSLPGDLLLVFGDVADEALGPLHMEWQRLGLEDLIQPADLPEDCNAIAPCFGNRCRMMSYPDASQRTDSKYPQCRGKDVWSPYWIPELQATQIGRAPFFVQGGDDSLPGQPLCTIASVQSDCHQHYPWVNVPDPISPERIRSYVGDELMIGDLGCIYISIEDNGTLHATESCF